MTAKDMAREGPEPQRDVGDGHRLMPGPRVKRVFQHAVEVAVILVVLAAVFHLGMRYSNPDTAALAHARSEAVTLQGLNQQMGHYRWQVVYHQTQIERHKLDSATTAKAEKGDLLARDQEQTLRAAQENREGAAQGCFHLLKLYLASLERLRELPVGPQVVEEYDLPTSFTENYCEEAKPGDPQVLPYQGNTYRG